MSPLHSRQTNSSAGFTLVEVAVSATVMLLVITGMLTAISSGMQMVRTSQQTSVASDLITHEINELRMLPWTTVSSLSANNTLSLPSRFAVVAEGMTIRRTVVAEATDLRRITFTISWTNHLGSAVSRSEEVLIAKNGLNASYGM